MADFATTHYLYFTGGISGSTLTQSDAFDIQALNSFVYDLNSDGDVDSGEYFFSTSFIYSGFTISLNSNTYAVFNNGGTFLIPFDSAFDDLASFVGQNLNGSYVQTGENAVVSNCFLTGTSIATPDGPRAIETLAEGDLVLTPEGPQAILWLARQTIQPFAANVTVDPGRLPVCIHAGALGGGLPEQDLYVSADHAMLLDGMLINAGALVDGDRIRFVPLSEMPSSFTYWHVELERHSAVWANGALSESFVDMAGRAAFDNYADYLARFKAERIIPVMDLPRISSGRLLPDGLRAQAA